MKTRKRDGRLDLFDPSKIAAAIEKAARAAGWGERLLAEELASVVTLFLEKDFVGSVVPSREIQETVERVLMETGHTEIARAFLLYRERRERIKEVIRVRESLATTASENEEGALELEVDAGSSGSISPWSKARIIDALVTEAEIPVDMAKEIATEVESKVFQSGLTRISSSLIRELVDNELFNRGLNRRLLHQSMLGIPGYDLRNLVEADGDGRSPAEVAQNVAASILKQYALRWIHSPEEAEAHLRGEGRIQGLEVPSGFLSIDLDPLLLPSPYGGPSARVMHLVPCIRFLERFVAQSISIHITDMVLHAYCACGISAEEYAMELMAALAQGPASSPAVKPFHQIHVSRRLTDKRLEILKAANMRRASARRYMDTVAAAFIDASIRLGRELTLPVIRLDLNGDEPPGDRLLSQAVLLEASGRLELDLSTAAKEEYLSAAIQPLLGRITLATADPAQKSRSSAPGDELQSALAMAAASLFSKNQYMKKLEQRGKGPKALIRRHLGGSGETVGNGYFEIQPDLGFLCGDKGSADRATEPCPDRPQDEVRELLDRLTQIVHEEREKMEPGIDLIPPWRDRNGWPVFNGIESALRWARTWRSYFPGAYLPPCFIGEADQRLAFLRRLLVTPSETERESEADRR